MEANLKEHTGFMLYDPSKGKVLADYKSDRYFTPASNTKIFTMFTALNVLGDSIPGLYFRESGDSLIFWGTGDPSFLYENVTGSNKVFDFLAKSEKELYFSTSNYDDEHFGPGWAWGDYKYYYQVERSPMPVFGNYFYVSKEKGAQTLQITNRVFKNYFWMSDSVRGATPVIRDYGSNFTDYFPQEENAEFTRLVPFRYSSVLTAQLLADTLQRRVKYMDIPFKNYETLYSVHIDSLLSVLMHTSDNFIAEQLLLTSAGVVSDTLNSHIGIKYAKENLFKGFPDELLWYDGSGLSRYNQFTPRTIVKVWDEMLKKVGPERLYPLLATGGYNGTIKNWYAGEKPYIFAKTGSLKNNHSLSGYLITDKGHTLIFSFMNSHFPGSSNDTKVVMQKILKMIKERY